MAKRCCRIYGMSKGTSKGWSGLYNAFGWEVLKKYKIRSETELWKWMMEHNGHEELKSSAITIMTKVRMTTFDERVEIVQYPIAHDHNCGETSVKYGISYQKTRTYTVKYEFSGVDALQDLCEKRSELKWK